MPKFDPKATSMHYVEMYTRGIMYTLETLLSTQITKLKLGQHKTITGTIFLFTFLINKRFVYIVKKEKLKK